MEEFEQLKLHGEWSGFGDLIIDREQNGKKEKRKTG